MAAVVLIYVGIIIVMNFYFFWAILIIFVLTASDLIMPLKANSTAAFEGYTSATCDKKSPLAIVYHLFKNFFG